MFGQQAPTFGQPQQAASVFGAPASSQSLFGTPQPFGAASSSSLFGASSASPFGAAATSGGLFGASSAGLFGGGGGGLFGAPASSGGLFGAAAPTQGGLFGASPTTGGLFGSSTTFAASSAQQGGLFGAPAASSAAFALFGGAASQPAGAGGLFGTPPAAAAAPNALVPANQAAGLAVQAQALAQQTAQEQQALVRELQRLNARFTPGQPGYKFSKLLLYVVEPAARQRPADVTEAEWQHALRKAGGAANPDGLWPVALHGFAQLQAHKDAQDAAVNENRGYLAELRAAAQQICVAQEQGLRQRAHRILQTHATLAHRLLQVIRHVDALEARHSNLLHSASLKATMSELADQLEVFSTELAPSHIKGLKHRAEAVVAAVDLQANVARSGAATDWIDEKSLRDASAVVAEHTAGLRELQRHLRKMIRDVSIMANPNNSDLDIMAQTV